MITLETELLRIKGLNSNFLGKFKKLGINTVKDLLWHFPYRYEDFSSVVKIADLKINQNATISAVVKKISMRRTFRKRMIIIEALLSDETGGIKAIWFNQPYIVKIIKPGLQINFAGKITSSNGEVYLSNPTYEPLRGISETKHTAGLIPVYPETKGLTSRGLRYLINPILKILPPVPDFIPDEILSDNNLPNINSAIKKIHFPNSIYEAENAKKRFIFESLFLLQLNNIKIKESLSKESAYALKISENDFSEIISILPFKLTDSQEKCLNEIKIDLEKENPMNRLLQGDVGSGKTVIASIAAIVAARNETQSAFMAPTEILAKQHYKTIKSIFDPILEKWNIKISLLVGGLDQKSKKTALENFKSGLTKIIIGTHALISESDTKLLNFNKLGLVIIDEQHRFGVKQRARLINRDKNMNSLLPHFLSMSATPIPRTLSLTLFGDLDLSIISELPKGRKSIITKAVAPENRNKAYDFIKEQIKKGRQAFVICPRIDSSDEKNHDKQEFRQIAELNPAPKLIKKKLTWETKAVKEEYEKLSKKIFPEFKVAMLHGKMKTKEKDNVMSEFKNGLTDILISTSVIEVGVDVPNATIMLIEGAERFGLAQLYQFRGRIGRGEHQSFCFLFSESNSQPTNERLEALLKAKNGFELAELDLAIRGPGEFLGDKQTGVPDLAMNSLNNIELIKAARESAAKIITKSSKLDSYPILKEKFGLFQKNIHLE